MPLLIEYWKAISGFESGYKISNGGIVRRTCEGSRTQANKILHPLPNDKGHIVLTPLSDRRSPRAGRPHARGRAFHRAMPGWLAA
jgi:hypothetical protein